MYFFLFQQYFLFIFSLLKGAEEERLRKPLKPEFGGGMKEFVYEERDCFNEADNKDFFLSSQERQSIILNMLYGLRASDKDELLNIKFIEGQPIGQLDSILFIYSSHELFSTTPIIRAAQE